VDTEASTRRSVLVIFFIHEVRRILGFLLRFSDLLVSCPDLFVDSRMWSSADVLDAAFLQLRTSSMLEASWNMVCSFFG